MSRNTVKTYTLLAALGGLLVIVGAALGGGNGAVTGLVIGLVLTGGSYWFSDTIVIRAARAEPVTEAQMPEYGTTKSVSSLVWTPSMSAMPIPSVRLRCCQ